MKPTVLIIDDDKDIRNTLQLLLNYEGFTVSTAANGEEGLKALEAKNFELVLLDVKMPGQDGLEVLPKIRAKYPDTSVMMISGHADIQTAVEAVKKGAYDFLEKPLDESRVLLSLRNCLKQKSLLQENKSLRAQVDREYEILGESPGVKKILNTIEKVAATEARVLITGENGTGKELVARQIHLQSPRRTGKFVAVNCAAIPRELIESELFGHEKGSFTGAVNQKIGQFESASGGTLFLDEIGDMDLSAQAKVLRAIEQNEITRVGGTSSIQVNPRIVAATNKDLQSEIEAKEFRMDLFYRLSVVPIHIPALKERRDDIALLAAKFLKNACAKNQIPTKSLEKSGADYLRALDWPGNVRELKNFMERAAVLIAEKSLSGDELRTIADHAPPKDTEDLFACTTFEGFKDASEAAFLRHKLEQNNWNIKKTAEDLQMQRSHLYKKLEKYNLR